MQAGSGADHINYMIQRDVVFFPKEVDIVSRYKQIQGRAGFLRVVTTLFSFIFMCKIMWEALGADNCSDVSHIVYNETAMVFNNISFAPTVINRNIIQQPNVT